MPETEEVVETTEEPATPEPEAVEVEETQDDAPLRPEGEKALEAWKVRARKAEADQKELAARVKEFEERDLSEQERLAKAAEDAKRAAEEAAHENLRLKVALDRSLPSELIDRLRGETLEELYEDADSLLALVKPREAQDFDGGARKTAKGMDRDEAVRLLKENPEEFYRLRDEGKVPDDILAV